MSILFMLGCEGKSTKKPSARDFTLNDINGQEVSLSSLRGNVVMLEFWAVW